MFAKVGTSPMNPQSLLSSAPQLDSYFAATNTRSRLP